MIGSVHTVIAIRAYRPGQADQKPLRGLFYGLNGRRRNDAACLSGLFLRSIRA
ncbi:MAG: hypothetical protein DESF_00982 [Desulfovibrio sp.]